jgi:transcriptional regulator with XRE-family HTH domain
VERGRRGLGRPCESAQPHGLFAVDRERLRGAARLALDLANSAPMARLIGARLSPNNESFKTDRALDTWLLRTQKYLTTVPTQLLLDEIVRRKVDESHELNITHCRILMHELNVTQIEIAAFLGVSAQTINMAITGKPGRAKWLTKIWALLNTIKSEREQKEKERVQRSFVQEPDRQPAPGGHTGPGRETLAQRPDRPRPSGERDAQRSA